MSAAFSYQSFTYVSVCKLKTSSSQIQMHERKNIGQSHACLMSVSLKKLGLISLFFLDAVVLFVSFLCFLSTGQGIQGAPGLPGVRGKPGAQVRSVVILMLTPRFS